MTLQPKTASAQRYFTNQLPEGGVRNYITRGLKIPNIDFDLLRTIGSPCASVLAILPVEQAPSVQRNCRLISVEKPGNPWSSGVVRRRASPVITGRCLAQMPNPGQRRQQFLASKKLALLPYFEFSSYR